MLVSHSTQDEFFRKKINRRQFIKFSLLTAVYSLLWAKQAAYGQEDKTSVIVIGAGISGLAAARSLQAEGFRVTILEARSRIGGRIWTDRSLGVPIDMGASWIHGIEGNPITYLTRDFQIKHVPTDYNNGIIYDAQGHPITDTEAETLESEFQGLLDKALDIGSELETDKSIEVVIDKLLKQNHHSREHLQKIQLMMAFEEITSGASLDEQSLRFKNDDQAFEDADHVFPGGYDQVVQGLAKGLRIKLNQRVQGVKYTDDAVRITTMTDVFEADYAILTFPLGVLKSGTIAFDPPLPDWKIKAISRLGMGVLNKVAFRFPEVFWPADVDFLSYISETKGAFSDFLNWAKFVNSSMLINLTGGHYARYLETLRDEEIIEGAMKVFKKAYGNHIPEPIEINVSRWFRDPFSEGSYSFIAVGAQPEDYEAMAEPVGSNLLFAGEATNRIYPATVHGAFLSGIREAERLIEWDQEG